MWIESHQSLRNHPKVKKAARIAGINEFEMIGRLHCLWWWALDYAPDGDLTNYSDDDIEAAVDWTGQPGLFVRSMIECGFNGHGGLIDVTQESREIHDWFEYAGKLLERRAANADRMREARATHVQGTQRARVGLPNQPTVPHKPTKAAKPPTPAPIETYRKVARKYPNKALWDNIAQTVTDCDLWERVITGYIALGWNPSNIAGMLEFYGRGEVPHSNGKNGNGHKPVNGMLEVIRLAQQEPGYGDE